MAFWMVRNDGKDNLFGVVVSLLKACLFVESKHRVRMESIPIVGISCMRRVKRKLTLMQRSKSKIRDCYFIAETWVKSRKFLLLASENGIVHIISINKHILRLAYLLKYTIEGNRYRLNFNVV